MSFRLAQVSAPVYVHVAAHDHAIVHAAAHVRDHGHAIVHVHAIAYVHDHATVHAAAYVCLHDHGRAHVQISPLIPVLSSSKQPPWRAHVANMPV